MQQGILTLRGNKLQGPFRLENTLDKGKVPMHVCGQDYTWFGDIGYEPMKYESSGLFVLSENLQTELKDVPTRRSITEIPLSLVPTEIYSRFIVQAKLKGGFKRILEMLVRASHGSAIGEQMQTRTNNLVVSNPFEKGSEFLCQRLLERLGQMPLSGEYKGEGHPNYSPAVLLTGIKYSREKVDVRFSRYKDQRKADAKFLALCHIFRTENDNAASTCNDEGSPEKRKLLALLHGIKPEQLEDLTNLDVWNTGNIFSVQGLGPVYYVHRTVAGLRNGLYQVTLWGEDIARVKAKGRLMRTREMRKVTSKSKPF